MDNENSSIEKKPKRPRIGENRGMNNDNDQTQATPYQSKPYQQNNGGYQRPNGYQRNFNRPQSHFNRPPQSFADNDAKYDENHVSDPSADKAADGEQYNGSYQQRPYYNNNRQGGYNNNRQGGYNNRQGGYNNRQGGYNNRQGGYNNRQGGYNNNRQGGHDNNRQGGYDSNRQSGGYDSNRQSGGYNNNRQSGGYNNNRQGGYNNNSNGTNTRQGGYNNNRQGGYNNRQGGYNNNRQGGYNKQQRPGFNQRNNGFPGKGKSFTPRPKAVEYEVTIPDPDETIRLNKFMANAGICSRREADEFIQQGLVKVNGVVVTELGTKIKHSDVVEYDEKVVALERKCYILLNKPKDCVTTNDDPNGRLTVMDLVKGACNERIYPVGRLDRNTTGVLLLTNDGDLSSKLTHPKYVKKKIYHVWTDHDITEEDMQRIADGIELEDGEIHADAISYATETDRNQAGIEIHSGRNRIVRRIFESLGYHVTKLDRVYFAGLTKKNLPRGRWRYLTQEEVNYLKMGSFE